MAVRGVALDDDPVRREPDQHRIEPLDEPRGQRIERLLRRHHLEVEIRMQREEVEDAAESNRDAGQSRKYAIVRSRSN